MINTYMYMCLHLEKVDITPLLKRMRNHKTKIEMSSFLIAEDNDEVLGDDTILGLYVESQNDKKNNSIYVGVTNKTINKPNELILKADALEAIQAAEKHKQIHSEYAKYTEEDFRLTHNTPIFKRLAKLSLKE